VARPVVSGVLANLAVGTLFGWSLVAGQATADVGAPASTGTAVFAAAIAVFTLALLGAGRALRSLGPRRLLAGAAVAAGAGLGVAATGQHPLALWCGVGLLFGAASGVSYGVSVGLAARSSDARRGTATGLVVGAYAAGPVLLGLVAPTAVAAFGWRSCVAGLALVVMSLLVCAAVLAPADRAARRGRRTEAEPPPGRTVVLLWLVFAGGAAPGLLVFAAAVPLATGRELTPGAAGAAVSLLAAGNLSGRLVSGWGSDRVGRLPALAGALAVAAASVAGLAGTTAPWLVLGSFAGTGLAYGAVSALVPAVTADRVGVRAFPRAYGRVFTAWGCAGLAAPVAGGALTGVDGEHPALVLVAAVPLVPAAVALLLLAHRTSKGALTGPAAT
jgi:OFA family oxalate/formate antiporter-like MFS transporter